MADDRLAEQHVRELVRSWVRAGLLSGTDLRAEVERVVAIDLPARSGQAATVADDWIGQARAELLAEQADWPEVTDYERLQAAFRELAAHQVVVLQGIEDHWQAKAALEDRAARGVPLRGVAWFTPPDVWHAVDEGMLEVNLWHASTANAAPGDALLDEVLAVLADHGLEAHFDEGRIEVAAHWRRRIGA